jgi:restriction system protein
MGRHPSGEAAEKAERDRIRTRSTLSGLLGETLTGFEAAVAEIFVANGYSSVAVRGGAGDLGVDISCRDSSGQSVAVQCKQYAQSQRVTSQEIQLFIGMGKMEHQADRLIYATTGSYTQAASDLASKHGVELFDGQGLVQLAERMTR